MIGNQPYTPEPKVLLDPIELTSFGRRNQLSGMETTTPSGITDQLDAVFADLQEEDMKKRTPAKSTSQPSQPEQRVNAAIGHNSGQVANDRDSLEILREILVGPAADYSNERFLEMISIIEDREEESRRREKVLEKLIDAVQTDVTEREQALNARVAAVEKDFAAREAAYQAKLAAMKVELDEREAAIASRLKEFNSQQDIMKAKIMQVDMDLTAQLSMANKQHVRTIHDVGQAITELGSQVSKLCNVNGRA